MPRRKRGIVATVLSVPIAFVIVIGGGALARYLAGLILGV